MSSAPPTVPALFLAALKLGCTSFGGPVAHLAHFRREYVERRGWIGAAAFDELVALCQFLPGPASSQTGFGLGYRLRGWAGGLAAWAGFTLPSAALMLGFALGLARLEETAGTGWLHGLKLAAAAVVAHAVVALARAHATDVARAGIAAAAAAMLLLLEFPAEQVAVLAGGGLVGLALRRGRATEAPTAAGPDRRSGLAPLLAFLVLLALFPIAAARTGDPLLELADTCYRAGALVFGGGHVVLPLLAEDLVGPGGLTPDRFLAGYGAAQALPGPLFTFATYLGAVRSGPVGALVATVAIFLPGLLLVAGTVPIWERVRRHVTAQAALAGANAAVVGLLAAALVDSVSVPAREDGGSAALALAAFLALQFTRCPSWAVVGGCAVAGALLR